MAKRFKLRISKAVSSSFQSCRSKDPSTLPQDPVPSFFPSSSLNNTNTQLIIPLPPSKPHHGSSIKHHVSAAMLTAGCPCRSRTREAYTSDDSDIRPPSQEFKWKKEEDKLRHVFKTTYDDETEQQPRRKTSYSSSASDDSDNDEVLAFPSVTEKNKRQGTRKKRISSKTRFLTMMSNTSSADESGIFSSEANWDDIDINDEEDETETLVSSCKSLDFSNDSSSDLNQELETISETTTTRRQKKSGTCKRRLVRNTRSSASRGINNIGRRSSISTISSSDSEVPPRLSVFKKLIPCSVDGKVKESFAIVKKSEDPYEDFKRSMMEMILEKQMFEKNDLEQLLQCFLSLNAKHYHGVIVEAFSEIWKTLFSAKS
ncbi:transcription repressor OFP7-like [Lycium barbarum]|uniref:transcription repressor OFP7-like n=1 Tax=Lycium barbarum TaxID=112863 RepID=UPI00293EADDC|nr:transcription repressor OFP7-like [Lycium barbarum]